MAGLAWRFRRALCGRRQEYGVNLYTRQEASGSLIACITARRMHSLLNNNDAPVAVSTVPRARGISASRLLAPGIFMVLALTGCTEPARPGHEAANRQRALKIEPDVLLPEQRALLFTEAELALAEIATSPSGDPVLDLATEAALSKAAGVVPTDAPGPVLQRARVLVGKAFPGHTGQQLATLLERYAGYRDALQRAAPTPADNDLAAEFATLATAKELQARYFGADAAALFGEQNTLTHYMLELRRLQADTSLDEQSRNVRLRALQEQLQLATQDRD
jgi:hypothetical protein